MPIERRKPNPKHKSSPLPVDFLKMVKEVYSRHFEAPLAALAKIRPNPFFETRGAIYPDEVVLAVSLHHKGHLPATTVYASCDYDPKASSPQIQDVINFCVDAAATLFDQLLDMKDVEGLRKLADEPLATLENVPFYWSQVEVAGKRVYLKIDKANLELDEATDAWLEKNDPGHKARLEREAEETEALFVTGDPNRKKPAPADDDEDEGSGEKPGGGYLH